MHLHFEKNKSAYLQSLDPRDSLTKIPNSFKETLKIITTIKHHQWLVHLSHPNSPEHVYFLLFGFFFVWKQKICLAPLNLYRLQIYSYCLSDKLCWPFKMILKIGSGHGKKIVWAERRHIDLVIRKSRAISILFQCLSFAIVENNNAIARENHWFKCMAFDYCCKWFLEIQWAVINKITDDWDK